MRGQIEKRGKGAYRLRWYQGRVNGERVYGSKTIRGRRTDAEKELRRILARQDDGYAVPSRVPTLAEYVETWKRGEAAAKLHPNTRARYTEDLARHVLPKLGRRSLRALHAALIEAEVTGPLREAGKHRTAQLAKAALSKVMGTACKDRALGLVGNPCHGVEVGSGGRRSVRPLDAEERARFREAIRGTPHEALFLVLLGTGLRPSEARALGWEHLDLERGQARVERTVDDAGAFHPPKTERGRRTVPLPPEARQGLRELHLRRGRPVSGLVFINGRGRVLSLRNLLRRDFRPALERAGLPAERVQALRLYDLRHGFATSGLEAGADVRTVADLMGHANTRLTMEVYQHVSDARKEEAAERIARALFAPSAATGTQPAPKSEA